MRVLINERRRKTQGENFIRVNPDLKTKLIFCCPIEYDRITSSYKLKITVLPNV